MISAEATMIAHLAGRTTKLSRLWLVTRADEQVFAFTDHDRNIPFDGVTYAARLGFEASNIDHSSGLSVGNGELAATFGGTSITVNDLRGGVWDHAQVRVRFINWADTSMGVLKVLRGWLGEVTHDGFAYRAEVRGLAELYNAGRADIVTPECGAEFCDARCGLSASDHTQAGEVTGVTSTRVFASDLIVAADFYAGANLTWATGANAGRSMEVKGNDGAGEFTLFLPMVEAIQVGDAFSILQPCDKSRDTCRDVYDNIIHFRGWPEVPGTDHLFNVGGKR